LLRAPDWTFAFDRAARGLGKVFWWRTFTIAFYGRTVAPAAAGGATAPETASLQGFHA
jgi:hypothetical protein